MADKRLAADREIEQGIDRHAVIFSHNDSVARVQCVVRFRSDFAVASWCEHDVHSYPFKARWRGTENGDLDLTKFLQDARLFQQCARENSAACPCVASQCGRAQVAWKGQNA